MKHALRKYGIYHNYIHSHPVISCHLQNGQRFFLCSYVFHPLMGLPTPGALWTPECQAITVLTDITACLQPNSKNQERVSTQAPPTEGWII